MHTPQLNQELVGRLYAVCQQLRVPMTLWADLVDIFLNDYLAVNPIPPKE